MSASNAVRHVPVPIVAWAAIRQGKRSAWINPHTIRLARRLDGQMAVACKRHRIRRWNNPLALRRANTRAAERIGR